MKDNISEKDLLKSMKRIKHKQTKSNKHHDSASESDSSNDDTSKKRHKRRKKQKKDTSSDNDNIDSHSSKTITKHKKEDDKKEHGSKYSRHDKIDDSKSNVRKGRLSEDRNPKYERSRKYMREEYDTNSKRQRCDSNKQRDGSRNKYNDRRYSLDRQNDKTVSEKNV